MNVMKVAILAPRHYVDELKASYKPRQPIQIEYIYEETLKKGDLHEQVTKLLDKKYDAYIGLVDWTSLLAAHLNHKIQRPSPNPEVVSRLQDKYLSRILQAKAGLYKGFTSDSRNVTESSDVSWPVFVKPRRASMSFMAGPAASITELSNICSEQNRNLLKSINQEWSELYDLLGVSAKLRNGLDGFEVESMLHHGIQVTLDGFVQKRRVKFFGFTKSVFLPNHISFKRFDYPFIFPRRLAKRIQRHARKVIKKSGYNHSLFNIEYKVDIESKKFNLVEFNTRPSSQFMYPIQLITGVHPLDVAIDIVLGNKAKVKLPRHISKIASVCVFRREHDAVVLKIPNQKEMQWFTESYPDGRWKSYALEGEALSQFPNDSHTYRYAEMTVSHNKDELVHNFEDNLKATFDSKTVLENKV